MDICRRTKQVLKCLQQIPIHLLIGSLDHNDLQWPLQKYKYTHNNSIHILHIMSSHEVNPHGEATCSLWVTTKFRMEAKKVLKYAQIQNKNHNPVAAFHLLVKIETITQETQVKIHGYLPSSVLRGKVSLYIGIAPSMHVTMIWWIFVIYIKLRIEIKHMATHPNCPNIMPPLWWISKTFKRPRLLGPGYGFHWTPHHSNDGFSWSGSSIQVY